MPDSFGRESRVVEVNGFRISETVLPARLRIEPHAHDTYQICCVLEGSYVERLPAGDRALRAGWMHARAAGVRHANIVGDDDDVLALLISVDRDVSAVDPRRSFSDLVSQLRAELRRADAASSTAIEGLSLLMLSRLQRSAPEPSWLRDAVSVIERRWNEPLSLGRVAREVGVHPSTLAIAFRKTHRTTVGERIRALRVDHAKTDLATTKMPLAEIAFRCGFRDQAHFTRVFRDLTGETPAVWRQSWSSKCVSARKSR